MRAWKCSMASAWQSRPDLGHDDVRRLSETWITRARKDFLHSPEPLKRRGRCRSPHNLSTCQILGHANCSHRMHPNWGHSTGRCDENLEVVCGAARGTTPQTLLRLSLMQQMYSQAPLQTHMVQKKYKQTPHGLLQLQREVPLERWFTASWSPEGPCACPGRLMQRQEHSRCTWFLHCFWQGGVVAKNSEPPRSPFQRTLTR